MTNFAEQIARRLMRRSLAPPGSYGRSMGKQGYSNPGSTFKPVLSDPWKQTIAPAQMSAQPVGGWATPPGQRTPAGPVPGPPGTTPQGVGPIPGLPPKGVPPGGQPYPQTNTQGIVPLPNGGYFDVRTQSVVTDPSVIMAMQQQQQQPVNPAAPPPGTIPINDGNGNIRYWSPTLQKFV